MNALHSSAHEGRSHPCKFCPCNMSHKVQQVELRATCHRDKIVARFVLHESKSMNSQEGTCRYNMSLGHVPATFSCVCGCCDFVPATCPCYAPLLNILHHKIFSLRHVPAKCPLVFKHLKILSKTLQPSSV